MAASMNCFPGRARAFSCKKRGFCPSCGAQRMVETGTRTPVSRPRRPRRPRTETTLPGWHRPHPIRPHRLAEDWLARLAALVPRPRAHRTRYHGVFATNCRLRARVVPSAPARIDMPRVLAMYVNHSCGRRPGKPDRARRCRLAAIRDPAAHTQALSRIESLRATDRVRVG